MSSGRNLPDDTRGADIEAAHGGRDLYDDFNKVEARWCVCCEDMLIPDSQLLCAPCYTERMIDGEDCLPVYECRRCGRWVEYAETGPHLEQHERNDAQVVRDE